MSSGAFWPRPSRSGKTLLVLAGVLGSPTMQLEAIRLADGTRSALAQGAASPAYHTPNGHLIYVDVQGRLVAARFDEGSLALEGAPIPLAEGLLRSPAATFAVSETGTIAYVAGLFESSEVQPVWVDRAGSVAVVDPDWAFGFTTAAQNRGISLSPDGSRVAVSVYAGGLGGDIYVKDLRGGQFSRLTTSPIEETRPRWTPNGESVTYVMAEGTGYSGFLIPSDMTATEGTPITDVGVLEVQVAPGSEWIAVRGAGQGGMDLWAERLDGGEERYDLPTEFLERAISVSPDGRWIAFESDRTGRTEVYVRSFPDLAQVVRQVSVSGGTEPRWGRTGGELFYIDAERRMVSVAVEAGENLVLGERTVLFQVPADVITANPIEFYALYDVDVDDQRFLMLRSGTAAAQPDLIVMLNAFELLKGR